MSSTLGTKRGWLAKWWMGVSSSALGVLFAAAALVGRKPGLAVFGLILLSGFGVLLSWGGQREAATLLRGEGDERQRQISAEAAQLTLSITAPILVVGFLWETAHGYYGKFGMVCSLMGFVSMTSTMWLRRRR